MSKVGICFLAYGDEHINECNFLIDRLSKFKNDIKIFVGSDSVEKINKNVYNIINITESFNYNLKIVSVREALKECDIIILMDSDIFLINDKINFLFLNTLDDGIYSYFIKKHYERNYINSKYQNILYNYNDKIELNCIHEYLVILKLSDEKKKKNFIYNWELLYEMTKDVQPIALDGVHYGAQEGLILYVSGIKSGIKCFDASENEYVNNFFNSFYHIGEKKKHLIKHSGTLI